VSRLETLALHDVRVGFQTGDDVRWVLDHVDLSLRRGEARSILGRSGAGKTVLSRLLIGLAPPGALLEGALSWSMGGAETRVDLSTATAGEPPVVGALAREWGRAIAYVPQGGARNLNPALTIHAHLARARSRAGLSPDADAERALLAEVGLSDPDRVWSRRPRALSGGMARRVLVALALAGAPDAVVVDEPTTGLDSERRQQVIALLDAARARHGFSLLMVTHEVGDAAVLTTEACVLAAGLIVDRIPMSDGNLLAQPDHDASRELVHAWRWDGWSAQEGVAR
jgi:ABC-type glutathione transport system ATPase component